jgi:hypothetical protein
MGSIIQRNNNLMKMLDGLSLLDNQDQERIIKMVDTLNAADENVKKEVFSYISPLKKETTLAYTDDIK